ncbi:acyltransferase family protein [Planosporangium sp. 12N6]|uniref:acyltransferase family protein n=1 Tax=Planosporangium spinosum TaxID=3402278 RepID=UPI003CF3CFA6
MQRIEHSGYRPALDGLRAVAVGAVIIYHLRDGILPGGFLGVDLFFVLSGYLITGLLLDEHARTGGINLAAFWTRRVRRLMPALLLMVVAVAVAVRIWAPLSDWQQRRGDLLATIFYYANWHMIAADQSYFAQFAAQSPLRHAWSLAIEEQFYLVWPLLVLALLRWRRRWMPAVLALGATASAITMIMLYEPNNPTRAYAGTDGRAQQLLIGALLALAVRRIAARAEPGGPGGPVSRSAYLLGPLAAAATIAFLFVIRDTVGFYYHGGATLIAVVMAVLIWAVERAPESPLARVLSISPARWVGRISYGLYLWHWPVIMFAPDVIHTFAPAFPVGARVESVLTLILATASYYLVERPIRRGRPRLAVGTPLRLAVTVPVVLGCLSASVVVSTNWTTGLQRQQLIGMDLAPCGKDVVMCWRVPAPHGRPVLAVVGDSTAMALDPGFVDLARRRGWGYVLAAKVGCGIGGLPFTLTAPQPPTPYETQCAADADERLRRMLDTYHPSMVFALSHFEIFAYATPDSRLVQPLTPEWTTGLHGALRHVAEQVTASGATLVTPGVLPNSGNAKACLAARPATNSCRLPSSSTPTGDAVNDIYEQVAAETPGMHLVMMQRTVCPDGTCPMTMDGLVVRYDGIHFTPQGARWFVGKLAPQLPDAGSARAQ